MGGLTPLQQHMQRQLQQHTRSQMDWDGSDYYERAAPAPARKKPRRERTERQREDWQMLEQQSDSQGFGSAILEPVSEAIVAVPKAYIAKVIGKGGSQVCVIREKSGAQIDARQQTTDPCNVKVIGTEEAIEKARDMIWDLVELASLRPGIILDIPRAKIGKVIGIRGAQINEIQVTTGAKVDVDKDCDPCKVTIGGDPDKVEHARRVILTLAMEAADGESEYLDLPKGAAGAVLGVQGARLRELQAQSGARIDVDKTQPSVCRVRIAGDAVQIAHAKDLVLLAVETPRPRGALVPPLEQETPTGTPGEAPAPAPGTDIVRLPDGAAGKIIGRGGTTIQALQAESGARIWVDCETGEARLQGRPECVEHARYLVEALLVEGAAIPGGPAALLGEGPPPAAAPSLYSVCPEDTQQPQHFVGFGAAQGMQSVDDMQAHAESDIAGMEDPEGGGTTDLDVWATPWDIEDEEGCDHIASVLAGQKKIPDENDVDGVWGSFEDTARASRGLVAKKEEADAELWGLPADSPWRPPGADWPGAKQEFQAEAPRVASMPCPRPRPFQAPRRVLPAVKVNVKEVKEEQEHWRPPAPHVVRPVVLPGRVVPRPTTVGQRPFGPPVKMEQHDVRPPAFMPPRAPVVVRGRHSGTYW